MRLSEGMPVSTSSFSGLETGKKKELYSAGLSSSVDKMKASNFPASILRIGNWEYVSRYEGDLVAKCYYAKHKLVWEVLDGGLKNKIEIQWSDITALKATYTENGSETLDVLVRAWCKPLTQKMDLKHWMYCLLGYHFSSEIPILNPENTLYGRQLQILLEAKQAFIGVRDAD